MKSRFRFFICFLAVILLSLTMPACSRGYSPFDLVSYSVPPTNTPTVTSTPTNTFTPTNTPTQTPAANVATDYVAIGDSYVVGNGAGVGQAFTWQIASTLNVWYPTTTQANFGHSGFTSQDYAVSVMASDAASVSGASIPRVTIQIGVNNLFRYYNANWSFNVGPSCSLGESASVATTRSNAFKTDIKGIINYWKAINPNIIFVVGNIPDITNNGTGPMDVATGYGWNQTDFQAMLAAYNARLAEIPGEMSNVYLADVYSTLLGHNSWYADTAHPNVTGYTAMYGVYIAQFASPPR